MLNTVIEPYVPSLIYMSSTEINSSYFNGVRFYDGLVTMVIRPIILTNIILSVPFGRFK